LIEPANGTVDFRSGHSLSAGSSWSLLGAFGACGVSSDLYIPQESSALRSNQQGANQLKVLQHTFSNLARIHCQMNNLIKNLLKNNKYLKRY
jgi:hypothetical protein